MRGDACRRDGSKTQSHLKKDIPRLRRSTAIGSVPTLGLTEHRARVLSPLKGPAWGRPRSLAINDLWALIDRRIEPKFSASGWLWILGMIFRRLATRAPAERTPADLWVG